MSAYAPPSYSVTPFNPAYFATSSGISLATASGLFLNKTSPDTATALETFTGGILSNSINSTTATTNMAIASSQTDGILTIGSGARSATGAVNIANTAGNKCAINILNVGGSIGNITGGSINIANGVDNLLPAYYTTSVNIGAGKTSGQVTIGNVDNLTSIQSSSVNIGSLANEIAISNQTSSTGNVRIASGAGSSTIAVEIANGTTTGNVNIGNTLNSIALKGAVTLSKPLILGTAPTASTQIGYLQSNTLSTFTATGNYTLSSLTLPAGVYLLNLNIQMNFSVAPTVMLFNFTGSGVDTQTFLGALRPTSTYSYFCTASQVVNTTASSYAVFVTNTGGTATSVTGVFQAVRIG